LFKARFDQMLNTLDGNIHQSKHKHTPDNLRGHYKENLPLHAQDHGNKSMSESRPKTKQKPKQDLLLSLKGLPVFADFERFEPLDPTTTVKQ